MSVFPDPGGPTTYNRCRRYNGHLIHNTCCGVHKYIAPYFTAVTIQIVHFQIINTQHMFQVTMVSPLCIPDLIASICVGVNGTVFLSNEIFTMSLWDAVSNITFLVGCMGMVLCLGLCMVQLECCCWVWENPLLHQGDGVCLIFDLKMLVYEDSFSG